MKRSLLLVLLAVCTAISCYAYVFESDGIYYNIGDNNTVSVTYGDTKYEGEIIIPSEVTYNDVSCSVTIIGVSAFSGCSGLTSITIPNSVTSVWGAAFEDCSGLTSVTIPNSVTSIYASAFKGCSGLTSITIPNSVTSIGSRLFEGCIGLTSIIVSSGNTKYDSRDNCNAIIETSSNTLIAGCKNTVIPNSVTKIGSGAFQGCSSLTSITIPNSVTSIGDLAFFQCGGLTSITISNSVTSIGASAFHFCSGLTSITIPNSVTSIGSCAFYGCRSLTSIDIPNSVTSIESYTLYGCSSLTSVTIPNSVTSIGGGAFFGCSGLTSIIIPSSVTSIGNSSFAYCSGLTSITIPNSVTSIDGAFEYCSGLTSIIVSSGNTKYDSRNNCNAIIETSSNTLITGCMNTVIPNSVTSIGLSAFCDCSGLTSITIPSSVTSIGYAAFWGCSGLTSIMVSNENVTYDSRDNCNAIIETSSNTLIAGCKNTVIPNSVTKIGSGAFQGCSSLTSITIPNSVTSIGDGAFYHCSGLTSITIPNSVTSIGDGAFRECISLTSVTIPNSVTSIYASAFKGCSGLTSITIPNSVTSIGSRLFEGCIGLTSIIVSSGNTKYDSRDNCNAIIETSSNTLIAGCKNTIIPNSVTKIGSGAFQGCSSLTSITIPNSVTSIGTAAFNRCNGLTSVISEIQNPFKISESVFSLDTYSKATLTVPAGTKSAYQATYYWNKFTNIVEKEPEQANDEAFIEKLAQIEQECVLAEKKMEEYKAKYYDIKDFEIGTPWEVRSYYDDGIKDIQGLKMIISSCEDKIAKGELVTQQERDELDEKYAVVRDYYSESITTSLMGYICTLTVTCNGGGQVRTWIDRDGQDDYGKTTLRNETKTLYWLYPKFGETYRNAKPDGFLEIIIEPDEGYVAEVNGNQVEKGTHLNGEGEYNVSFTKSATPTTYSLSITASGNGSALYNGTTIRRKTSTFVLNEGANAVIAFSPDNGWRVKSVKANGTDVTERTATIGGDGNWYIDGVDTGVPGQYAGEVWESGIAPVVFGNIREDMTVEVEFEAIPTTTYTLSITASGNGSATYNGTSIRNRTTSFTVDEGTSATITFTPDNGNSIASVKLNNSDVTSQISGNSYTISNITANTTLAVTFQEDVNALTVDGLNYTVTSQSNRTVTLTSGGSGQVLIVPATITQNGTTWKVTGIDKDALKGNTELAAIIWNPEAAFTATVSNPNLLLYVKSSDYAPAAIQNVVVNGTASTIVLAEAKSGNNFYCPQSFVAQKISYTHNYQMQTGIGEARGWETIALPFDVQTITHATKGTIKPFAQWKSGDAAKPFWLYELAGTGFVETESIKAYTPYIISMPNNPQYDSQWLLNGKVTFAASSVTIGKTENLSQPTFQSRAFIPCFAEIRSDAGVHALNVNNDFETNNSGMTEGSRFVLNMRSVHPFEAYMKSSSSAPPYAIGVFEDMTTGIQMMVNGSWTKQEVVYDLQGRKVNAPSKKGVYIINGKKKIIR